MLALIMTTALAGSLGLDVGAGVGVSAINLSGTNNIFFLALGPPVLLRLHADELYVESCTDVALPWASVFDGGGNAVFAGPGVETLARGSSIGTSLVVGYRWRPARWTFALGAGPWVGFVPYSCDCASYSPSFGAAVQSGFGVEVDEDVNVEAVAQVASGTADPANYRSPAIALRPALRVFVTWTLGDR